MAFLGAFVVGISVGLFGAGGSILNIPILIYVVGEREKVAIAESLAIVGLVAAFAAVPYARKSLVAWRTAALFGGPGMIGSYLGAALAAFVPEAAQLSLLAVIMILAAVLMFRPPPKSVSFHERANWKIVSDGLLVGIFTGLVGVGGGFLIVPTLVLLGGLTMHEAVATSLVIIAAKSATGFVKYLDVLAELNLHVNFEIVGIFSVLGALGSFAGGAAAHRLPQAALQKLFAVALVLLGTYLVAKNVPDLLAAR